MHRSALLLLLYLLTDIAWASQPASGTFVAGQSCEAYQSFRKKTNPGAVKTEPGREYRIREIDERDYQWLRIEMPGNAEPLRWVPADCGDAGALEPASSARRERPQQSAGVCQTPGLQDSYVLAITWQPGFCEHKLAKSKSKQKPECRAMESGELNIANFTLHGLWPNKKECGKNYGNCSRTDIQLSEETLSYIKPWMPNFYFENDFGNYEWKKHGTCQTDMDDDAYFRKAVTAVRTVNDSELGQYIRANIGKNVERRTLQEILRRTHPDAPDSFAFLCTDNRLHEIQVHLPVDFREGPTLAGLIGPRPSRTHGPTPGECSQERILIERSGR
ncbi:Ribonuclease T2 [Azotobacter vinelandii CA]|uniref:Ribonuclease T2 n=2 Tax=Azotobacter vinelandii TaxID=354 RepID=C1DNT9_AZOVD|nr:ribonuclease T2 [Azotobacter vinelandii]ACO77305.1 Ribonuclease T2 [Azotobacter vinelandii DJ]AGK17097.1 Ribonuclease T2 [Azotobacter vinelandii CA]AGK19710.1 Ribonuclease T2 [Azotobacter vinelandii CA6]WKN22982.1 ribonuclease T2 [Azotobacter vinelandii]SFX62190.1 ribonuclease T2 [Azotobacter vinelandii]